MKTFAITPTLIALALVGVLSACGKSNTARALRGWMLIT